MSSTALSTEQVKPTMLVSRAGLQLRTLDEVWRFAQCLAKSGLAPKGIESPEAITIAVQMGMEIGLPPMAALQNIAVINGRPSLWGDAQLAVCRATGEMETFEEWFEAEGTRLERNPTEYKDSTAAVCRVKRASGATAETAFSVADAKRAGLWDKAGPWKQYPFRMLRFRARSYALRDAFGDALRGLLTAEEAQDLPPKQVSGHVVEPFPLGNDSPPAAGEDRQAGSAKSGHASEPSGAADNSPAAVALPPEHTDEGGRTSGASRGSGAETARVGVSPKPAPSPPSPARGATPARRTPKPVGPPLELSGEPEPKKETAYSLLTRKIEAAGLVHPKVEAWLAKQPLPPLAMLSATEAAEVLELFRAMEAECRP